MQITYRVAIDGTDIYDEVPVTIEPNESARLDDVPHAVFSHLTDEDVGEVADAIVAAAKYQEPLEFLTSGDVVITGEVL